MILASEMQSARYDIFTMSEHISVLHISDIQFGRHHRFGQLANGDSESLTFDTLFDRLGQDLNALANSAAKPQILVVSGDLAEIGAPAEFDDALEFLERLVEHTAIPRSNVVLIPGNHDINRKLSEGYCLTCEGLDEKPVMPFWPKWKHYVSFFRNFYKHEAAITFTETEPWTYYEIPDFKVVVAGLNSTMAESHKEDSHYGQIGEKQMRWFAERLRAAQEKQWFRIGVVHHNVIRGPTNDDENLRDTDQFKEIVVPHLNCVLHGHTHKDALAWLDPNIPVISTGSTALKEGNRPEDVGNQYQIVFFHNNGFERWTRRYDVGKKAWIGDTRPSKDGNAWKHNTLIHEFSDANATFSKPIGRPKEKVDEEQRIVLVDKPFEPELAKKKLESLPRLRLQCEEHHRAIRLQEQADLQKTLKERQYAWLVCDWGFGKEGFLASALEGFGEIGLSNVFRLQCGAARNSTELFEEAETQFGISFQEFSAAVSALPIAFLIFDDLPNSICSGSERDAFDAKTRPLRDFCPRLNLVFITRQPPSSASLSEVIRLNPLETPETRLYLRLHKRTRTEVNDPLVIENVQSWSGGLPMHLDRLLERLQFLTLSDILSDESGYSFGTTGEPIPESLKHSVSILENSETKHSRQSLRLLKVLTVLHDGETYQSIRRFYSEPFHQTHIDELVASALIEHVPISQTTSGLSLNYESRLVARNELPRLLRIPRQVRDHVNGLISDEEREEIVHTSTGLFFGNNWWRGKIKLRNTLSDAYGHSAISGPGNEHIVARFLLERALDKGNERKADKYARLALGYCHKLRDNDRFRDQMIASHGIMELLRGTDRDLEFSEAAVSYAHGLRMTGHCDLALKAFEEALDRGSDHLIDDNKARIQLNVALCQKALGNSAEAEAAARRVLALKKEKESYEGFQAEALIASVTLKGSERLDRLRELERDARNHNQITAANNVALELAETLPDNVEALRYLEKVMFSAKGNYSRTRAIIEKAKILRLHFSDAKLTHDDRRLLSAAYSYSYGQRMTTLFNECHGVLWEIFHEGRLWDSLLRLFRFSSFIWRIRENYDEENKCLAQLNDIDLVSLKASSGRVLETEIAYLERRRASPRL